jgi:hypothetical protein
MPRQGLKSGRGIAISDIEKVRPGPWSINADYGPDWNNQLDECGCRRAELNHRRRRNCAAGRIAAAAHHGGGAQERP